MHKAKQSQKRKRLKLVNVIKAILVAINTTELFVEIRPEKIFRPVRDLNPWPLRYRCSGLPTELTSQLGTGCYVDFWMFWYKKNIVLRATRVRGFPIVQKSALEKKRIFLFHHLVFLIHVMIVYWEHTRRG